MLLTLRLFSLIAKPLLNFCSWKWKFATHSVDTARKCNVKSQVWVLAGQNIIFPTFLSKMQRLHTSTLEFYWKQKILFFVNQIYQNSWSWFFPNMVQTIKIFLSDTLQLYSLYFFLEHPSTTGTQTVIDFIHSALCLRTLNILSLHGF